jgi:hypothetical protein
VANQRAYAASPPSIKGNSSPTDRRVAADDLDVFDAQGRFVAVAAERVQDLLTASLACSERFASRSASTRAWITASSGGVSSHEVCSSVTVRSASWASRAYSSSRAGVATNSAMRRSLANALGV